jgi:hypothetical protein
LEPTKHFEGIRDIAHAEMREKAMLEQMKKDIGDGSNLMHSSATLKSFQRLTSSKDLCGSTDATS